jgi:hypothetical protein
VGARSGSVVEDHEIEPAKALGVGDQLDLNDLPAHSPIGHIPSSRFVIVVTSETQSM